MGYRHYDVSETKPQFAFGYGMSYTTFKYSDLRIDREKGRDLAVKDVYKRQGQRIMINCRGHAYSV